MSPQPAGRGVGVMHDFVTMVLDQLSSAYKDSAHNSELQQNCTKYATIEGFKAAAVALAISGTAIIGATRLSSSFARSLSVSAKTALIVTAPFGAFFLYGELAMNECAQHNRQLQRSMAAAAKKTAAAAAATQ